VQAAEGTFVSVHSIHHISLCGWDTSGPSHSSACENCLSNRCCRLQHSPHESLLLGHWWRVTQWRVGKRLKQQYCFRLQHSTRVSVAGTLVARLHSDTSESSLRNVLVYLMEGHCSLRGPNSMFTGSAGYLSLLSCFSVTVPGPPFQDTDASPRCPSQGPFTLPTPGPFALSPRVLYPPSPSAVPFGACAIYHCNQFYKYVLSGSTQRLAD
jgi:hypothetical protein